MGAGENTIEFVVSLRGGASSAADADKVKAAVAGVGGEVKKVGDESVRSSPKTDKFTAGLKRMAIGLGAVGAGYAAWNAAKSAITYTSELAKGTSVLAKSTGLSVGQSSKLVAVSGVLGVESGKLSMILGKLGKATVAQSEHTGKSKTAFDRLGISQVEARAHLNDTGGVLDLVTRKLATSHIPAVERAAALSELFGRGWQKLSPLLLEGEVGLGKMTKMAKEFGLELGGKGTESLGRFREQMHESELASDGLKVAFTKLVAGPLGGMLSGFSKLTVYARKGQWTNFNREVGHIGDQLAVFSEKIAPKLAGAFARIGPTVVRAFWRGFLNAPLGSQVVLGGLIAWKMGLTGSVFSGIGRGLGARLAGGVAADTGIMGAAGGTLGAAAAVGFGAAFVLGSAKALHAAAEAISPGYLTPHSRGDVEKALAGGFNGARIEKGELKASSGGGGPHAQALRPGDHLTAPKHVGVREVKSGGRTFYLHPGEHVPASAASVLAGARRLEPVAMPKVPVIEPLKPGSLAQPVELHTSLVVDGSTLARVVRKQVLASQAAGA